jgi:ubiquinone/menaquinone biosynthesis C-methylase UbiE
MLTADGIRDANVRYHDLAARHYDSKWGINYDDVGRDQVVGKLRKALGREPGAFERALEIGAGTGYFTLNLLRAGVVREAVATDISPGMLGALSASAAELGLAVETRACEAAALPFEEASFDLVFGHAVLHHVPDLGLAFDEFRRVLRPGGTIAFCGEPSAHGDRIAALPKRAAIAAAPLWRRLLGAGGRDGGDGRDPDYGHALEAEVDVHAFAPAEVRRVLADAGFTAIRIRGEELLANLYGWWLRTLESTAVPAEIPDRWRLFAFRSYLMLQRLDGALLEPRLPPELFYNLVVSARKPG